MKKILLCGSMLVASAILVSACSGDDDDDGGSATITSGAYTFTGSLTQDDCGFGTGFYEAGGTADVTVSATEVSVNFGGDPYVYTINGQNLQDEAGSGSVTFACDQTNAQGNFQCGTSQAYTCTVTQTADFGGEITGADAFTLNDTYSFSGTGAQCAAVATSAGIPLPCTSVDTGNFTK